MVSKGRQGEFSVWLKLQRLYITNYIIKDYLLKQSRDKEDKGEMGGEEERNG